MNLVPDGRGWRIEGPGAERARVAYACLDGNGLTYELEGRQPQKSARLKTNLRVVL